MIPGSLLGPRRCEERWPRCPTYWAAQGFRGGGTRELASPKFAWRQGLRAPVQTPAVPTAKCPRPECGSEGLPRAPSSRGFSSPSPTANVPSSHRRRRNDDGGSEDCWGAACCVARPPLSYTACPSVTDGRSPCACACELSVEEARFAIQAVPCPGFWGPPPLCGLPSHGPLPPRCLRTCVRVVRRHWVNVSATPPPRGRALWPAVRGSVLRRKPSPCDTHAQPHSRSATLLPGEDGPGLRFCWGVSVSVSVCGCEREGSD